MWLIIDPESQQKICGKRFDTQKDMAEFLGIPPQTLSRELKLCRSVFRWKGKDVQVVNQKLTRYSIKTPEGCLYGTAKSKADLARILCVTRQAVSWAFSHANWEGIRIKGYRINFSFDKEKLTTPCKLKEDEKPKPERNKAVLVTSGETKKFYPSMAKASKDLGIDSKTISSALKSGINQFRRRSDGAEFQVALAPKSAPADLPESQQVRKKRSPQKEKGKQKGQKGQKQMKEEDQWLQRMTVHADQILLERYPDYSRRGETEQGQSGDKIIVQALFGVKKRSIEIKNYSDFKDIFDRKKLDTYSYWPLPEEDEFNKMIEYGQCDFKLKLKHMAETHFFRTLRLKKR